MRMRTYVVDMFCARVFIRRAFSDFRRNYPALREKFSIESRQFDNDLSVTRFNSLLRADDATIGTRIELILSEYEYEKYTSVRVPATLTEADMKLLLECADAAERRATLSYLYKRESAQSRDRLRRLEHSERYWSRKRAEYEQNGTQQRSGICDARTGQLLYGLWHNTLVSKISPTASRAYHYHRLRVAALFGQKLIIDLDFDDLMRKSDANLLCKQIAYIYGHNRYRSSNPFDLHFTNVRSDSETMKRLPKHMTLTENSMLSFHAQSYTQLFPADRLLYLSPDAREPLVHHDCDDIYIIGGIIDRRTSKSRASLEKARAERIRVKRLPIDEHVIWGKGSKYLCLNHVVAILHDWIETRDWSHALRTNIPQRKQKQIAELEFEESLRIQKFKRQNRRGGVY